MAKRKKKACQTYTDARTVMMELMARQKEIDDKRKELDELLYTYDLTRGSNLNEPWTVKWACEEITTQNKDGAQLFKECMMFNKQIALNTIKQGYYYNNALEKEEVSDALDVLMDEPDMMYEALETEVRLKPARIAQLWELHGERWFKEQSLAPVKLEKLCRLFRKHVTHDHLELMVKRFVGRKMDDHARRLQNDIQMNLPQDLKDMLEGCVMMKHLMKANKNQH